MLFCYNKNIIGKYKFCCFFLSQQQRLNKRNLGKLMLVLEMSRKD